MIKKILLIIMKLFFFSFVMFLYFNPTVFAVNQPLIHHEIRVVLDIDRQVIRIKDSIRLPDFVLKKGENTLQFSLIEGLKPVSLTHGVLIKPELFTKPPETQGQGISLQYYILQFPHGLESFDIKYQGHMNLFMPRKDNIDTPDEHTKNALISPKGIHLDGSSHWVPSFGDGLMTFSLEVKIPVEWDVVSQGKRTQHTKEKNWKHIKWESFTPQEEIFLIAGKFIEYGYKVGNIPIMVFLRTPDRELADQYLQVADQYLKMYETLIGQYPYAKFALVENAWESGLGMPSFTLIGSKVLRLPFILHSSFPHEILHNWWGNGVYVDYDGGNWSEGLTTYLADHLIKEQEGKGVAFRRTTLQRYSDYTREGIDFPLSEFRERGNIATQSVGYGKTMMLFHMLRKKLGDDLFTKGLQKVYTEMKFKRTSFFDLEKIFSDVSGKNLHPFFEQWVARVGAPILKVVDLKLVLQDSQYALRVNLKQIQSGPAYLLKVPISITLKNHAKAYQDEVLMDQKEMEIYINFHDRPLRFDVDPEFDLFRRLDPKEIPPTLGASFGSNNVLFILPSAAPKEILQGYQEIARSWARRVPDGAEIKLDKETHFLPKNRGIWIFGWENSFLKEIEKGLGVYDASYQANGVQIEDQNFPRKNHSFVFTIRNPNNPKKAISWFGTDIPESFPGLKRKLPHYGKYSYLVFKGKEPNNILKKQWPVFDSPMSIFIHQDVDRNESQIRGKMKERKPLVSLQMVPSH